MGRRHRSRDKKSVQKPADASITLLDVVRLPFSDGMCVHEEDHVALALVSKSAREAMLESLAAPSLPKPTLPLLVRNPRRLEWAAKALNAPTDKSAAAAAARAHQQTLRQP